MKSEQGEVVWLHVAVTARENFSKSPPFAKFLYEIESHVISKGIITFTDTRPGEYAHKWDIRRLKDGVIVFGAEPKQWAFFYSIFYDCLIENELTAVVLRCFLNEKDDVTGLPLKELRAYVASSEKSGIAYRQLSARETAESFSESADTGKPIQPEESVIYCGPNGEKLNESFLPM